MLARRRVILIIFTTFAEEKCLLPENEYREIMYVMKSITFLFPRIKILKLMSSHNDHSSRVKVESTKVAVVV